MRDVACMIRALAVLLLLAFNAAAQPHIEPDDPTSNEPVTLYVVENDTCPPAPVVTRSGFDVRVVLGDGPCLSPPVAITHRIELGVLPAGLYHLTVIDASAIEESTFTVLDANGSIVVSPPLGPSRGGNVVQVYADVPCTSNAGCVAPEFTFGGNPAAVVSGSGMTWRVIPPPHEPGAVEVRATRGGVTRTSFAYRYYDPVTPPLPQLFERILVPVVYDGPGASGSIWRTEVVARNAYGAGTPIELWRSVNGIQAIPPSAPVSLALGDAPGGVFLIVPRVVADDLHLNAVVRDISRESREWGTELPIVREREFRATAIDLLNIPIDGRYRHRLRVYALSSYPTTAAVSVYWMADGDVLRTRLVPLVNAEACSLLRPCASNPAFAALDDLLSSLRSETGRVGIRIQTTDGTPLWAFVSLTNNETQHVTIVSPQ